MNKAKRIVAGSAVIAALGLGAALPAIAQDAAADANATEQATSPEDQRAARDSEFAAALAAELDLDADTVATALERVRDDMLAEHEAERRAALQEQLSAAVEAGELTQEQADALLAAQEAGVLRGFAGNGHAGGPGGHGGPGGPGGRGGPLDAPSDGADSSTTESPTSEGSPTST